MIEPRRAVREMAPYSPPTGGREGKLRLDFNENTIGCSPRVIEILTSRINADRAAIYPEYVAARERLAQFFAVESNEMTLTNGTDEAIALLVNTFVEPGDEVIILTPSYAMYTFYSELAGAEVKQVNYRRDTLDFPLDELLAAISETTKAVFISNPNNPTGTAIDASVIQRILCAAPRTAVLIDEAYFEFCGVTALPFIRSHENLFVSRTFSKVFGMAAMRVGCLFSHAQNMSPLRKAQSPYSVNMLGALAAQAAVDDGEYVRHYVTEITSARDWLYRELDRLRVPYHCSAANFVLLQLGDRAKEIRDAVAAAGILIRDRSHEIPGAIRVTVGTREQMQTFVTELEQIW